MTPWPHPAMGYDNYSANYTLHCTLWSHLFANIFQLFKCRSLMAFIVKDLSLNLREKSWPPCHHWFNCYNIPSVKKRNSLCNSRWIFRTQRTWVGWWSSGSYSASSGPSVLLLTRMDARGLTTSWRRWDATSQPRSPVEYNDLRHIHGIQSQSNVSNGSLSLPRHYVSCVTSVE